jgi:hypothetical protein
VYFWNDAKLFCGLDGSFIERTFIQVKNVEYNCFELASQAGLRFLIEA